MACDPLYNRRTGAIMGFICSHGKRPGSRTRCSACGTMGAPKLCDGVIRIGPGQRTCDAPLCSKCAAHVGLDRDLCPWCVNAARDGAEAMKKAR